jgi:hypothetical protein
LCSDSQEPASCVQHKQRPDNTIPTSSPLLLLLLPNLLLLLLVLI